MNQGDPNDLTDKQLIQRFGEVRDQDAFAEIVRRHGPMVVNTAKRIVGNDQDAEDVCQATFFAFARIPEKLKASDRIAGWLHESARRTALFIQRTKLRDRRKMAQAIHIVREDETRTDSDPTKRIANDELRTILDDELSKLPVNVKTAIVLCDLEGISQRQAAKRLGLPSTTIGNYVTKGRKLLSQRLARRGVTLSVGGVAAIRGPTALGEEFVKQTTDAAMLFAAGQDAVELGVSSTITELATRLIASMKTSKFVSISVAAIALVLLAGFIAEKLGGRSIGQAIAQEVKIVVPNEFANAEADALVAAASNYRYQQIVSASEFTGLGGKKLLTRWSNRPDVTTPPGQEIVFDHVEIRMSTTSISPDDMSHIFEENITGPETLVYDGPWEAVTEADGPDGGPNEFDIHIDLMTPFPYDPNIGNLLFDIRTTGGTYGVDQILTRTSRHASIWSGEGGIDSLESNGAFFGASPVQLTFVPEPSSMGLAALGLTGIHACFRRRSLSAHA